MRVLRLYLSFSLCPKSLTDPICGVMSMIKRRKKKWWRKGVKLSRSPWAAISCKPNRESLVRQRRGSYLRSSLATVTVLQGKLCRCAQMALCRYGFVSFGRCLVLTLFRLDVVLFCRLRNGKWRCVWCQTEVGPRRGGAKYDHIQIYSKVCWLFGSHRTQVRTWDCGRVREDAKW